jgi:heme exporter protein D
MNLEDRIKGQFPGLIVTLLSVLIGVAFSDLVGVARAQMMLWPLNMTTLRTWGQIFAMGSCCFSVWIIFAHMGVSRLRIPALADAVVVFIIPLAILFGNSLIGHKAIWPWFYFASFYLALSLVTWQWQVHIALAEIELASFARLTRPLGPLSVIYVGIPFYAAAGWADGHGLLSPVAETLAAMSAGPAACLTAGIFVREWQRAIIIAQANGA